tara:strand:+ start:323 stop:562 length:240 start_codon:yes stop_codon:yes gene_type:complete
MNILNETPETMRIRRNMIFRLNEELSNACDEIKKDALYQMYLGSTRTIMTYQYFVHWTPLEDLKTLLEQVREENNKDKF